MGDYCRLWRGQAPPLQPNIVERAQIAEWPSVLFFTFDRFPHNSRKFDTGLWGNSLYDSEYLRRKAKIGSTFLKSRKTSLYSVDSWYSARAPPLLKFGPAFYQILEESEEIILRTRYFRKKDPFCKPEAIEWIEMNGREYYSFVTDPQNKDRFFIDMGDVVLEVTEAETRDYKAEKNHNYYIRTQEGEWSTVSLYAAEDANGCSGEEVAVDEAQDVETKADRS